MRRGAALVVALPLLVGRRARGADANPLVARLRAGGVAVLLRHATTDPSIGDLPGFDLGACSTKRNLSADGRAQAQRIGMWFKAHR